MKKTITAAACAALGLAMMLGLAGCGTAAAGAAPAADAPAGITVSASAVVRLVPDKAAVTFGVTTQEETAEEAQSKNSEAVKNVMDVLTGRGIEEKSIRTNYYNMYPQYDWSEDGEQRIIGYVVTTSMTVQDQDVEDLGKLLSACVAAGINNVDSVSFLCSSRGFPGEGGSPGGCRREEAGRARHHHRGLAGHLRQIRKDGERTDLLRGGSGDGLRRTDPPAGRDRDHGECDRDLSDEMRICRQRSMPKNQIPLRNHATQGDLSACRLEKPTLSYDGMQQKRQLLRCREECPW